VQHPTSRVLPPRALQAGSCQGRARIPAGAAQPFAAQVLHAPLVGLVVVDAATLAQWGWNGGAWAVVASRLLEASLTYDPPSLAAGADVTTIVTVSDAALRDFARASFSLDLQGITLTAWVSAADTVSVRFQNGTAGAIDLASGTLRVRVETG
jgi:hypothetical protein